MRRLAILLAVVALAVAQNCQTGENYIKIIKTNANFGGEESIEITGGATPYITPTFPSNEVRTLDVCLPAATNGQYTMTFKDSYGDGWSIGSLVAIQGVNGNTIYKGFMIDYQSEAHPLSVYSPINKGDTWKYSSTAPDNWKDVSFSDASWTNFVPDVPTAGTGTQYFRKSFTGVLNMAAYELQIKHKVGVIAYLNGVDVYRQHMPEGPVTSATMATGEYSTAEFYGVIRQASSIQTSNILAVELHPYQQSTEPTFIFFDAFIALYAGENDEKCYTYPHSITATSTGFTDAGLAVDYMPTSTPYTHNPPAEIDFQLSGNVMPMVNTFRIFPYSYTADVPNALTIKGGHSSTSYETLLATTSVTYTSQTWKSFHIIEDTPKYSHYKLIAQSSTGDIVYIPEFQLQICNRPPITSITYPQLSYTFYASYESADISPQEFGLTGCSIQPPLPAGVSINSGCSIVGISTAQSNTLYTVTAMAGNNQVQGQLTIQFSVCAGSFYKIVRSYQYNPGTEHFKIISSVSATDVILEIPADHTHTAYMDWSHFICITQERFDVVLYSTASYWAQYSYISMYYLLPDGEQELVAKGRYDTYESNVHDIYLRRPSIGHSQQWFYKFDSVPANWHDANTSGWATATKGTFPTASTRVQLYKQTFNIAALNQVSGLYLNIRYRYGVVVYINGKEAWRYGVSGDDLATATVTSMQTSTKYYTVTLPGKQMATPTVTNPQTFLQANANTIAIAVVAPTTSENSALFDAVVRLMPSEMSHSHLWEITTSSIGIDLDPTRAFTRYYYDFIETWQCGNNELIVTLNNERREWVSSVEIQNYYSTMYDYHMKYVKQFKLYGRNSDDNWTLLTDVSGLTFSLAAQKRRIYFPNNTPYNQFKFENFSSGNPDACEWFLQSLDLYADNTLADIPNFTYPTTISIFKNIEMAEVIPENIDGYYGFTVSPALPAGIVMDPFTGWISGTATADSSATYTISANKVSGGTGTAIITIEVSICTGGKSLMTVRFRADDWGNQENSWKLFQGRGTSGTPTQSVDLFPVNNAYYYVDFCLNDGIYTLEGCDGYGDGWVGGAGYTLTVDLGEMEVEMQQLYGDTYNTPISISTVFSSYFPFQIEYTNWKVTQMNDEPAGWKDINFNDATWSEIKAAAIPPTDFITTYIRKTFTVTGINDYQVLNVRVKYSGGLAVHFNGNLVARFNLEENFISTTTALEEHDPTVFSKFHIILATAGLVEGNNVIAFEVHRSPSSSSSDPVVFDATGVFGVEDCSIVVDSFSTTTSSNVGYGTLEGMLDLDPYTSGQVDNAIGKYVSWTVENLEGSKWNSFNILIAYAIDNWGFDVNAYPDANTDLDSIVITHHNGNVRDRTKPQIPTPAGLVGFRKFKWEITTPGTTGTTINSIHMSYCKATGAVCPAIDNYPAVAEGQISAAACPEGYKGYSYRTCENGQLGSVNTELCTQKPPVQPRYRTNRLVFVMGTKSSSGVPSVKNIVNRWYVDNGVQLPKGMTLDSKTGEISGTPTEVLENKQYTIHVENDSGAAQTIITIHVRKGICNAEGVFPITEVGVTAVYECSQQGNYIGTQKRECRLGTTDGEWGAASGVCVSVITIVIIVVVVVVVIAVVVFVLIRTGKKTKAVGGVKGKSSKTMKSSKKSEGSKKTVKV